MYAIRLHEFGPPENLRYEQVPDPTPGADQARIAVAAAGVHLIDTTLRSGRRIGPPLPALPAVPGREVAGVVDAVGPGVPDEWLGSHVVAHLGPAGGGYAELAVADVAQLLRVPPALTDAAAVAMVGTGRTALAILEQAALTADDVVLVTAAAGGLGSLLVQAGRNAGATVVGAAGGQSKVDQVRRLGADVAVDYAEPGWPQAIRDALGGRQVTVALDGVGGEPGRGALELLGPGGRLLMFGLASGRLTELSAADVFRAGLTVTAAIGPHLQNRPGGLEGLSAEALATAADGRWVPLLAPPYRLADAAAAHTALAGRQTTGKVVLVP
jgi:NADPH2:quinone reductase